MGKNTRLKKWGKTLDCVSCFPLHFFRALSLPACFTTEQSTVKASLFVKQQRKTFVIHLEMFVQRLRGYIATCDMTINHTHVDFDIAYPNSVQDACHI